MILVVVTVAVALLRPRAAPVPAMRVTLAVTVEAGSKLKPAGVLRMRVPVPMSPVVPSERVGPLSDVKLPPV